jgi:CPA1 family monovalent cation:H+ antiporter
MSYHILFSMLVVISALASYINYKFLKLPKTIGLTIVTLIISMFVIAMLKVFPDWFTPINHLLGAIDFKETVLNVMLGYLLFAGALHVNAIDLRKNLFPIIYLASFGVLTSTILSGLLIWWVSGLIGFPISLPYCLLFGALISPTDPIAVLAVFKETKAVPKKIKMRITGEALFNDAAGILLFVLLMNIFFNHTGTSAGIIVYNIFHEALGGIIVGWILASTVSLILKNVDDKEVAILVTLAISSAGYVLSQKLEVSAPIAMVIAGLVIGSNMKKGKFTKRTIIALDSFWELIDEVLNAFLFVLIGLEMLTINFHPIVIVTGIIAFIVIFITRYISVSIPTLFLNIKLRKFYWRENLLMSWGGIRGGISIALALSIPSNGSASIISLTYVVVIISILGQGSTFKWLVNKLFPQSDK